MDNSGKLLLASLTAPAVIIIWVLGASPHALAGAPSVLYAGPNWRGEPVYKSTDGGENWSVSSRGLPNGPVDDLAIDPTNPATLYAMVGGVFKSTDGGDNWRPTGSGCYYGSLLIDPLTPSTIYASCGGIYKSTDAGESWRAINVPPAFLTLAIDPLSPDRLYAGTGYYCFAGGLFGSTDGGDNWFLLGYPPGAYVVHTVAVDPVTPSTLYVAAGHGYEYCIEWGCFCAEVEDGSYKSTDGGATWRTVNFPEGVTFRRLAFDLTDPSTVYAGVSSYYSWFNGVYKSTDGGENWSATSFTGSEFYEVVALEIDPTTPFTVYTTALRLPGVYKTTDGGEKWREASRGLPSGTHVKALAVAPAGVGDNK